MPCSILANQIGRVFNAPWKYCGVDVSPTQIKYNSEAHGLCLELADFLSREGSAYSSIYKAEAANTFPERAKLVVARAMLAHIFEQWKEHLRTLTPEIFLRIDLFRSQFVWLAGSRRGARRHFKDRGKLRLVFGR